MIQLVERLRFSTAAWWHWSRAVGFGTPTSEISQYTNGNYPDPWQRYAIVSPREELCCVAGAGSGKTTVLTARIIFLMARREVAASEIRAVTFMKKAATEMSDRIQRSLPGAAAPVVSTIHSFCYREILRLSGGVRLASLTRWWSSEAAKDLRLEATGGAFVEAYRVAGGVGDRASARDVVFELGRDLESLDSARANVEAARLVGQTEATGGSIPIGSVKRIALSPGELLERAEIRREREAVERPLRDFYCLALEKYDQFKRDQRTVDFNDLLAQSVMRLIQEPPLRQEIQDRYSYLMIDEYQDTSPLQVLLLEYLVRGENTSLFVVGDDWQSICGFQDADPRWLVRFQCRHRKARRVTLGTNYRCLEPVVRSSTEVIRRHLRLSGLADKRVTAMRRSRGPRVDKKIVDEGDEAKLIVDAVNRQVANDKTHRIFVLARSNGWLSRLGQAFQGTTIPYELRDETYSRAAIGEADDEDNEPKVRVVLTTIHRAKGLEADHVHVAGLADWLLPTKFRDTLVDRVRKRREQDHLGEELRILYVGMTRARETLTLWIPCWNGRVKPSRFLPLDGAWCGSESRVTAPPKSAGRFPWSGSSRRRRK
jgi:superfamily I DNA/RNA helicase